MIDVCGGVLSCLTVFVGKVTASLANTAPDEPMVAIEVLKSLQELYLADDLEIPADATSWSAEEAERYFESGGETRPAVKNLPAKLTEDNSDDATNADEEFMRKRRILAKAAGVSISPAASRPPSKPAPRFGTFRWLVDISSWEPAHDEWQLLLRQLPEEDATKVKKFHFVADQKRALVSRYLQRRACFEATGVAWPKVKIERTKGGKPFMANKPRGKTLVALGSDGGGRTPDALHANWNFNVSHEGKYVVLAADPVTLCGVDVAAPEDERAGGRRKKATSWVEDNLSLMQGQLTAREMAVIDAARPNEHKMEEAFRKFWALKEAYTKARGDGLGFEFQRCDFAVADGSEKGTIEQPVQRARVAVDGRKLPRWSFYIQPLEADHWTSVARGPPTDIVDALGKFRTTFGEPALPQEVIDKELAQPEPPFELRTVADLIADELRAEYAKAAAR